MIRKLIAAFVIGTSIPAYAQTTPTTAIADVLRGSKVTVQGTVQSIDDEDEFILADPSGTIEVYVGPNGMPVTVGENVSVTGYIDNDRGSADLCASRITRADGTSVEVLNCDD